MEKGNSHQKRFEYRWERKLLSIVVRQMARMEYDSLSQYYEHSHHLLLYYNLSLKAKIKDILLYWITQENLMEFLVQTSLPYILQTMICVYTTTNLLSSLYTSHKANILVLYYIILSILKLFTIFSVSCNCMTYNCGYYI